MKAVLITAVATWVTVLSMHASAAVQPVQPETNAMLLKCKRCDCCRI